MKIIKFLLRAVRQYGENIPPLINAYMNLSPSMKTFGTINNEKFGECTGNRYNCYY